MRLIAILELPTASNSEMTSALLRAAYQASRRGPVGLIMPKGADRAVDRQLDPLVAANRHVHGIRYGQPSDSSMWASASGDTLIVASSFEAQRQAAGIGAGCLDPASGLAALSGIGAE